MGPNSLSTRRLHGKRAQARSRGTTSSMAKRTEVDSILDSSHYFEWVHGHLLGPFLIFPFLCDNATAQPHEAAVLP
jgi:hypothetical protein